MNVHLINNILFLIICIHVTTYQTIRSPFDKIRLKAPHLTYLSASFLVWNEGSRNESVFLFWMWVLFLLIMVFLSTGDPKGGSSFFLFFFFFLFVLTFFDFCIVFNSHSFGDAVQHSHHRHCIQELRLQLWHQRKSNGKRLMSPWTFLWPALLWTDSTKASYHICHLKCRVFFFKTLMITLHMQKLEFCKWSLALKRKRQWKQNS